MLSAWDIAEAGPMPGDAMGVDPGEQVDRWVIGNDDEAEWAMRKLASAQARLAAAERKAEVWRSQIDAWLADVTAADRSSVEFFRDRLERYAVANRAATGEASLRLPSGTVTTRKVAARIAVEDPTAVGLLGWVHATIDADQVADVVKVTERVRVRALADWLRAHGACPLGDGGDGRSVGFAATGEVVPGVTWVDEHVTVTW